MKVISLGWGVQSWALAAMSALGVLPPVDAAIHADTTHERSETYAFAKRWTPWLEERGVRVVVVQASDKATDPTLRTPALFTVRLTDGKRGKLYQTCTDRWKIRPMKKWSRKEVGGEQVEKWIGITLDEVARLKPPADGRETRRYPFVEMLDRPWTRGMALRWLQANDLEIPVKSSCVFCPHHDRATWREIKQGGNGDWERAVEVDHAIRDKRPGYRCYLTAARIPLEDVDFRSQEDHGQLTLWDEECSGMCFL